MNEIFEGFEGLRHVWRQLNSTLNPFKGLESTFNKLMDPESEEDKKIVRDGIFNTLGQDPNAIGPRIRDKRIDG